MNVPSWSGIHVVFNVLVVGSFKFACQRARSMQRSGDKRLQQAVDLAFVRFSVTATRKQSVKFRIPVAERHAGEEAGVERVGEQFVDAAFAVADDELLERRRVERQREAVVRAELLGGVVRLLQAEVGRLAQALRAEQRRGRSSPAGRTALGSCRCCSSPFRGGCVARGFAA